MTADKYSHGKWCAEYNNAPKRNLRRFIMATLLSIEQMY
jgi:hypothetical protein